MQLGCRSRLILASVLLHTGAFLLAVNANPGYPFQSHEAAASKHKLEPLPYSFAASYAHDDEPVPPHHHVPISHNGWTFGTVVGTRARHGVPRAAQRAASSYDDYGAIAPTNATGRGGGHVNSTALAARSLKTTAEKARDYGPCFKVHSWNSWHKQNGYDGTFFGALEEDFTGRLQPGDRILAGDGATELTFANIGPKGRDGIRYVYIKEHLRATKVKKMRDGDCWRRRARQECIKSDVTTAGAAGSKNVIACKRSGGRVCHALCQKTDAATRTVMSNGIPPSAFNFQNGDALCTQEWKFSLPKSPVFVARSRQLNLKGPIGVSLTGVPLSAPTDWPCCANAGKQVRCAGGGGRGWGGGGMCGGGCVYSQ